MPAHSLLDFSKPLIMGILNITPDSFSDGGQFLSTEHAVAHAMAMVEQGADIIDVGGESTRPGAKRVGVVEQTKRVIPVIQSVRAQLPSRVQISIDTTSSEVATAALDAGAGIINDVSAGRDDPGMFRLAAFSKAPIVLMHMKGTPETMQQNPSYRDVVSEVVEFLRGRADAALQAGVSKEAIILDPGIGFGKNRNHNLSLLGNLACLVDIGYPLLLGTSRKRFMGSLSRVQQPRNLMPATCGTTALGVMVGVAIFRVHDVMENRQAADVAWAIKTQRDKSKSIPDSAK
jgi:dihydropteroate synthase